MYRRACCVVLLLAGTQVANAEEFTGKSSDWHGFQRYQFVVSGRRCWVVVPKVVAELNRVSTAVRNIKLFMQTAGQNFLCQ